MAKVVIEMKKVFDGAKEIYLQSEISKKQETTLPVLKKKTH